MEFDKVTIGNLKKQFDEIINIEKNENIEFWYGRDLQKVLGYNHNHP